MNVKPIDLKVTRRRNALRLSENGPGIDGRRLAL